MKKRKRRKAAAAAANVGLLLEKENRKSGSSSSSSSKGLVVVEPTTRSATCCLWCEKQTKRNNCETNDYHYCIEQNDDKLSAFGSICKQKLGFFGGEKNWRIMMFLCRKRKRKLAQSCEFNKASKLHKQINNKQGKTIRKQSNILPKSSTTTTTTFAACVAIIIVLAALCSSQAKLSLAAEAEASKQVTSIGCCANNTLTATTFAVGEQKAATCNSTIGKFFADKK